MSEGVRFSFPFSCVFIVKRTCDRTGHTIHGFKLFPDRFDIDLFSPSMGSEGLILLITLLKNCIGGLSSVMDEWMDGWMNDGCVGDIMIVVVIVL